MANLKPFPPGVSGNPAGASRGKRWRTVIMELADKPAIIDPTDIDRERLEIIERGLGRALTTRDVIALKQLFKAGQGDTNATRLLMDREEGRPGSETEELQTGGSYLDYLDGIKDEE